MNHKAKMIERRKRQRARTPGFTAVRNARIDGAIQTHFTLLKMQEAKARESGQQIRHTDAELQQNAVNAVANMLPPARRGFYKHRIRPSKSDNPLYRKTG